jgi:hypothetical protein
MNGGKFGGITYIADNFTNQKIPRPYQSLHCYICTYLHNIKKKKRHIERIPVLCANKHLSFCESLMFLSLWTLAYDNFK